MKVLVVDDEDQFAAFVHKGLEAAGFAVDRAATGGRGLEAALREGVSLVLLDVGLPDIDGFSVLAELRRERPDLPVIMLTARGGRGPGPGARPGRQRLPAEALRLHRARGPRPLATPGPVPAGLLSPLGGRHRHGPAQADRHSRGSATCA